MLSSLFTHFSHQGSLTEPTQNSPLYLQIAQTLAQLIYGGTFKIGQRLPSLHETE